MQISPPKSQLGCQGILGCNVDYNILILFALWRHNEKVFIYKPGREFSPGTESTGTLILNF